MNGVFKYWSKNDKKYTNLKYFFMSVGCNDVVHKTPHQLFTSIHELVVKLKESFPGIKVILSEVTPRMDEYDKRVEETNVLLQQYVRSNQELFLTRNSNLRNPDFYWNDGIHLKQSISARFANNMKIALRAAYGIKKPSGVSNESTFRRNVDATLAPDSRSSHPQHPPQLYEQQVQKIRNEFLLQIVRAFQYSGT